MTDGTTQAAVALYQAWSGYPDSPVLTSSRPYQVIYKKSADTWLSVSSAKFRMENANTQVRTDAALMYNYVLDGASWYYIGSAYYNNSDSLYQANNPVYTDATLTTVYFAKTTP